VVFSSIRERVSADLDAFEYIVGKRIPLAALRTKLQAAGSVLSSKAVRFCTAWHLVNGVL